MGWLYAGCSRLCDELRHSAGHAARPRIIDVALPARRACWACRADLPRQRLFSRSFRVTGTPDTAFASNGLGSRSTAWSNTRRSPPALKRFRCRSWCLCCGVVVRPARDRRANRRSLMAPESPLQPVRRPERSPGPLGCAAAGELVSRGRGRRRGVAFLVALFAFPLPAGFYALGRRRRFIAWTAASALTWGLTIVAVRARSRGCPCSHSLG